MQRWFRFSGTIALVSLLASGIPPHAHAEEKPGSTTELQKAADAAADADTALDGFDPHDLPTPRKHQLKLTPLQIANHRIKRLNERLVAQNNRIAHLEALLGQQNEKLTAQEETIKSLQTSVNHADEQIQAAVAQIATVAQQVQGIESHQAAHAARSARAAQQAMRGLPQRPGGPNVQTHQSAPSAPIPRALPVGPTPTPEPTVLPPPEGSIAYEIKGGDNLTRIARNHGTTVAEILKINKILDARKLQIGQTIYIPPTAGGAATPAASPAAPAEATPAQP